jgi:UDP-N-acetylmuramyl pentapeptide synthase
MGFDSIAAVGGESAEALIGACRKSANCHGSHFDNNKEFISQMEKWIDDVDGILVKGSRRARMEEVCEAIRNRGYV